MMTKSCPEHSCVEHAMCAEVTKRCECGCGSCRYVMARLGTPGIKSPLAIEEERRMVVHGKFRVYFNRHGAEPLMWCVAPDAGGWELAVRDIGISTHAETVYRKKETPDEDDGRPSAWFAVEGVLTVNAAGFATIGSP